jgi:hypothetical protein
MPCKPTRRLLTISMWWGDTILRVAHLTAGDRFCVGTDPGRCDFVVPRSVVNKDAICLARVDAANRAWVWSARSDCCEVEFELDLPHQVQLGSVHFDFECSSQVALQLGAEPSSHWSRSSLLLSAFAHALVFAAIFWVPAKLLPTQDEPALRPGRHMHHLWGAVAGTLGRPDFASEVLLFAQWQDPAEDMESSRVIIPERPDSERGLELLTTKGWTTVREPSDYRAGGSGRRAIGKEGPIGNPEAPDLPLSWGIRGPPDNPWPETSESAPERGWPHFPMDSEYAWDGPLTPWHRREVKGRDAFGATGKMYGEAIGDPRGAGLGVAGKDRGGAGRAQSIGVGSYGAMGHGSGRGLDMGAGAQKALDPSPFRRHSRAWVHAPSAPSIRTRVTDTVIARVAETHVGQWLACFEGSTAREVEVRFEVSVDGTVTSFSAIPSPSINTAALSCLRRVWSSLTFLPAGNRASSVSHRLQLEAGRRAEPKKGTPVQR